MASKQTDVVLNIKNIKDTIRKKYKELKNRSVKSEREDTIQFKPIIEPIEQLTKELIKREEIKRTDDVKGDELEDAKYDDDSERDWEEFLIKNNIGPRISTYLRLLEGDNSDTTYGVKWYDDNNEWKLGDHPVHFEGDTFVIDNDRYPTTNGLLELVFTKIPRGYNQEDLKVYKNLLLRTQAHLKSDGKINSNKGHKYNNIIAKLFPPETKRKRGRGIGKEISNRYTPYMKVSNANIDYRHWDDPNELVDRLQLLIASKQAGNTGHDNEIISILEELKEAGIIKDFNNFQL